ncbi:MAG: hypothetical protein CUN52_04725 [Phototrophicales bacterium]|nr:MAG: hypothetical protein CUN52_04725 [Phototrophicales bacterium]
MNKRITQNIFEGINPVLNEILLQEGRWQDFHSTFLVHLRDNLKASLIDKGYRVGLEESIQVQRLFDKPNTYYSDLLISQSPDVAAIGQAIISAPQSVATQTLPIPEAINLQTNLDIVALVIRRREDNKPITWIELLSPTNKLPNQAFYDYQIKREYVIHADTCFIEFDFIHTQPPMYPKLNAYKHGGHPFHMSLIIPRPDVYRGTITLYHFGIADHIPNITIPLDGDDIHLLNLNAVYQKAFIDSLYGLELDYENLDLSTYLEHDRQYIIKRVAEALHRLNR